MEENLEIDLDGGSHKLSLFACEPSVRQVSPTTPVAEHDDYFEMED
jgi:hypothetical protein